MADPTCPIDLEPFSWITEEDLDEELCLRHRLMDGRSYTVYWVTTHFDVTVDQYRMLIACVALGHSCAVTDRPCLDCELSIFRNTDGSWRPVSNLLLYQAVSNRGRESFDEVLTYLREQAGDDLVYEEVSF